MSLRRSVIVRCPSASRRPMSPVRNQPPGANASRVERRVGVPDEGLGTAHEDVAVLAGRQIAVVRVDDAHFGALLQEAVAVGAALERHRRPADADRGMLGQSIAAGGADAARFRQRNVCRRDAGAAEAVRSERGDVTALALRGFEQRLQMERRAARQAHAMPFDQRRGLCRVPAVGEHHLGAGDEGPQQEVESCDVTGGKGRVVRAVAVDEGRQPLRAHAVVAVAHAFRRRARARGVEQERRVVGRAGPGRDRVATGARLAPARTRSCAMSRASRRRRRSRARARADHRRPTAARGSRSAASVPARRGSALAIGAG